MKTGNNHPGNANHRFRPFKMGGSKINCKDEREKSTSAEVDEPFDPVESFSVVVVFLIDNVHTLRPLDERIPLDTQVSTIA